MKTLNQLEAEIIRDRLLRLDYNILATARSLGISHRGLRNKLHRHGILVQGKGSPENNIPADERFKNDPDQTGYKDPTPKERDDWYNQDYE